MADILVASREEVRKDLANFLKANMNTPLNVFPYLPADLKTQSPITAVTGAPSTRTRETPQTYENKFGLSIRNIAIYAMESQPQ